VCVFVGGFKIDVDEEDKIDVVDDCSIDDLL